MRNAFEIVKDFEQAVAQYTGAPYCVAVNSCTNALFLCLKWQQMQEPDDTQHITIPRKTYISVPMQILHAGYLVDFNDEPWRGEYRLEPFDIWDSAKKFTSNMWYENGKLPTCFDVMGYRYKCLSFHWNKILGIQQGGAILTNNPHFDKWARRARFDGRTEGVKPKDDNPIMGWHMYMSPEIAAEGLVRLMHLPKNNPDLPPDDYPDLSQMEIFK